MDYPIHIDKIIMGLFIFVFKGIAINGVFLCLKIVFILANSADPASLCGISSGSSLFV